MDERLLRLSEHIKRHPSDYQSVISFYKLRSKASERERRLKRIPRLRLIAECRRKLNGK